MLGYEGISAGVRGLCMRNQILTFFFIVPTKFERNSQATAGVFSSNTRSLFVFVCIIIKSSAPNK